MKIAMVAPLFESVPATRYGATERVIANLCNGLTNLGCDVTLFASGDSKANATLFPVIPEHLWSLPETDKDTDFYLAPHYHLFHQVVERAEQFDMVHFHTNFLHFPFIKKLHAPHVTTIHFRLDRENLRRAYWPYQDYPLVSISNSQRTPLPSANWVRTIYHGLPKNLHAAGDGKGGYAVFLGRMSPNKGPEKAIQIALKAGLKIKLAAKINEWDVPFYESEVKPLLSHPDVEYIGMVDDREKQELLENAACLLFPIAWPEPFGLVMIESLACGTPVIAFNNGSVPEVIEDGKTGFVVDSVSEAVQAIQQLPQISRDVCRREFEHRFSCTAMAKAYLESYYFLADKKKRRTSVQRVLNGRPRTARETRLVPTGGRIIELGRNRIN